MNSQPPFYLGHQRGLDGLRGFAISLVLLWHGRWLSYGFGFIAVNTFFVLSGFLITTLLIAEWDKSGAISLRHFYARRALRLLPALVAMLLAFTAYVLVSVPARNVAQCFGEVFWALFYFTNWAAIFSWDPGIYLGHTWSLSVEEQFYFVWPLLLLWLLKNQSRTSLLCWISLGLVLAVALRFVLFAGTNIAYANPERLVFGSDTRTDSLLAGCFTGVCVSSNLIPQGTWFKRTVSALAVVSVPGLWFLGACRTFAPWMVYFGWLLASAFAAFLILGLLHPPAYLRWLFENPVAVYLGRISYGLYLWHVPILTVMQKRHWPWENMAYLLPAGVATLACYYLVEMPCLRLKKRFQMVQ